MFFPEFGEGRYGDIECIVTIMLMDTIDLGE